MAPSLALSWHGVKATGQVGVSKCPHVQGVCGSRCARVDTSACGKTTPGTPLCNRRAWVGWFSANFQYIFQINFPNKFSQIFSNFHTKFSKKNPNLFPKSWNLHTPPTVLRYVSISNLVGHDRSRITFRVRSFGYFGRLIQSRYGDGLCR